MIWFAPAAAAIGAPPAKSPATGDTRVLFRADDYPAGAMARGEQGSVVARLVVNPAGHVELCTVIASSHSSELDRVTCDILRSRARFSPAHNDDGAAIYAVVITPPITWSLGGPGPRVALNPDVELELNHAPAGLSLPLEYSIQYVVTANAKIEGCKSVGPQSAAVLADLACNPENLPQAIVIRNSTGKAVDAMYSARDRFVLGKP